MGFLVAALGDDAQKINLSRIYKLDANTTMSIEEEKEEKAGEVQLIRTEGLILVLDTPKGTYIHTHTPAPTTTHSENDKRTRPRRLCWQRHPRGHNFRSLPSPNTGPSGERRARQEDRSL